MVRQTYDALAKLRPMQSEAHVERIKAIVEHPRASAFPRLAIEAIRRQESVAWFKSQLEIADHKAAMVARHA